MFQYENPWTIPNMLSMTRIGLAPVLGYLIIEEDFSIALGVFALAGLTDLVSCEVTCCLSTSQSFYCMGIADSSLFFLGRKSSRWSSPGTLCKDLSLASVWDSYSLYDLRKVVKVVWGHRRGSVLLLVFNFFIIEEHFKISKEPSTCIRDRNKGKKLWDCFSVYCNREKWLWSSTRAGFYWWTGKQWASSGDQGACRGRSSAQVCAAVRPPASHRSGLWSLLHTLLTSEQETLP